MISAYLIDIIIMLMAAVIAVPLFQASRLGAVPGFVIAGIVVGPSGLGLISNISEIGHLAEIGVVLLLFIIGIGLKPSRLWLMRRLVFGLGSLQVLITGIILGAVGYLYFDVSLRAAILVGFSLSLSSTAFVLQLLTQQKMLGSVYGRTSIAVLLLQDLAVIPLLALVPLLAMPHMSVSQNIGLALLEALLIVTLVVLIGRYLLHPILHRVAISGSPEVFTASAVLIVLGTALLTEHAGLSMAMGAFLAGLLISDSAYKHQILAEVQPFRGLLLGLFFMSMGMLLNVSLLFNNFLLSFGAVSLLIIIKAIVLFPASFLFGLGTKNSLAVALLLAQSGEFALVVFSLAHQGNILNDELFQQLLLVVLLSMLATPVLSHAAWWLIKSEHIKQINNIRGPDEAPIVLAGFGRVGHRIGEILSIAGKPFVAMDSDAMVVDRQRENGYPVFYGDVRKPELLEAACAGDAQVIIVTLDDPKASEQVVESLRKTHPQANIYVRGHSLSQCRELRRLGASAAVSENVEASLELARMALLDIGVDGERRETILGDFRRKYYAQIDEVVNVSEIKERMSREEK